MSGVSRTVKVRAYVATSIITALLGGVAYKAYGLQVKEGAAFAERAYRQHVHTIEIPAPRGEILDARDRPLAVSADADSIYANPREVVDVVGTADRLGAILGLDAAALEARLSTRKAFTWIARHVTPEAAAAVKAAKLPGVEVTTEPRRWYPAQATGGTLIGFSGIDGDGLDGLELRFDHELRGEQATFAALRDARGKTALADGFTEAVPGATVHLTIDRAIQDIADRALADVVKSNDAKAGIAVVLDVQTGAVLAMSSVPTYDPNEPGDAVKAGARNRAVTDVFEIGSIMKVFLVASALDARVTTVDEWWDVEGGVWKWNPRVKPIRDTHHDESLTTAGIIKRSSNVGAAKIGFRLGRERLYAGLRNFGFGARTGIELPHEETGTVRDGKRWRDIELATISFGYGLTVTPLQVAAAMAAIGDHGRWHTPHLVDRITDAAGNVLFRPDVVTREACSARAADRMLPVLASVFDSNTKGKRDGGTAASVYVDGFRAGGKTATSEKLDLKTKRYAVEPEDKIYLASFAGLAPIDAPRIAVVVVIDEPGGKEHFGGTVAGPAFARIVSDTLRYLGVAGDGTSSGKKPTEAAPAPEQEDVDNTPDAPVIEDAPVTPELGADAIDLPDFTGLGLARAIDVAREAGVAIEVHGSGVAVRQEPAAGRAPAGTAVTVTFAPNQLSSGMEIGESARSSRR